MKVSELMVGYTPDDEFEGFATNDDWVLAVGIGETTSEKDYTVVQQGIATSKTGTQRTFAITGDRYIGDAFQDYCFGIGIAHGVGQKVVVPYVYFSILTGKGEKGTVSIIVNSDGGGNAGENSSISIDLRSVGTAPTEYTYSAV